MIEKELKDIALPISEPEYRAMPELSYSTLSNYEKLGFNGLDHLFDKVESPSLTFGSVVDTLLTDGYDEFVNRFSVLDAQITDNGLEICKRLISMGLPYPTFKDIPEEVVSYVAKEVGFWKADKWDKVRYSKVLETGNIAEYFEAMGNSNKTIIDTKTYGDAMACINALRNSPVTAGCFAPDDISSPIRRYYQLKFKANLEGVGYRSMMDLIIVDYEDKIIYPYDLKTMGTGEWNFEDNFMKYHYYIQARLYWRVLRDNLDRDPYFKDFKLENFKFIVINRVSLTPLIWEFPLTKEYGTLISDKGEEIKDPFDIGKELRSYLDNRPRVPKGINEDSTNVIKCLKLRTNN